MDTARAAGRAGAGQGAGTLGRAGQKARREVLTELLERVARSGTALLVPPLLDNGAASCTSLLRVLMAGDWAHVPCCRHHIRMAEQALLHSVNAGACVHGEEDGLCLLCDEGLLELRLAVSAAADSKEAAAAERIALAAWEGTVSGLSTTWPALRQLLLAGAVQRLTEPDLTGRQGQRGRA